MTVFRDKTNAISNVLIEESDFLEMLISVFPELTNNSCVVIKRNDGSTDILDKYDIREYLTALIDIAF